MKKNIKEMKKQIFKLMKGDEFSSYYYVPVSVQSMEKKKFKKLVKKISKKYNVIVVLNRDKILIHDIHTDMYDISDSKNLTKKYNNIVIEDDTVVLVHSGRQSDEFGITDGLALFNNFIHKDKFNTKVLFYAIEETTDNVFCPYLLDKLFKYKKHNKKMYKKYPDFIKRKIAYKNKYLNNFNIFCSYIEKFTENSRYKLLKDLDVPDENVNEFELENLGGKQITNLHELNKMNEDLFDGFIVELFQNMFYVTHKYTFAAYLTALYYDVCWKILYDNSGKDIELSRIDSSMDIQNKTVTIYEKINIKDEFDDYEIGENITFTFDELYDMIVIRGEDYIDKNKGQDSFVFDTEPINIVGEPNLISFPMKAEGMCSDLENCLILFEKALYYTDRKNYTIEKMDKIHRMFFERRSSTRYLFTRKCTKTFSDDLFTMKNVHLLFLASSDCLDETIRDFAGDVFTMIVTACLNEYGSNENYEEIKNMYKVEIIHYDSFNEKLRFKMTKKIDKDEIDAGGFNIGIEKIPFYIKTILEK